VGDLHKVFSTLKQWPRLEAAFGGNRCIECKGWRPMGWCDLATHSGASRQFFRDTGEGNPDDGSRRPAPARRDDRQVRAAMQMTLTSDTVIGNECKCLKRQFRGAQGAQVCAGAFAPGLAFSRGPQGWRQLPCQCFQAATKKSGRRESLTKVFPKLEPLLPRRRFRLRLGRSPVRFLVHIRA